MTDLLVIALFALLSGGLLYLRAKSLQRERRAIQAQFKAYRARKQLNQQLNTNKQQQKGN